MALARRTPVDHAEGGRQRAVPAAEEQGAWRTFERNGYYVITPLLPELARTRPDGPALNREYSSADSLLNQEETWRLLETNQLMPDQSAGDERELLR